jgi:hypothetical protein
MSLSPGRSGRLAKPSAIIVRPTTRSAMLGRLMAIYTALPMSPVSTTCRIAAPQSLLPPPSGIGLSTRTECREFPIAAPR